MSDYSHHDRHRSQAQDYYDNVGSGGGTWLWVGIALFAILALGAAIFAGDPVEGDGAAAPDLAAPSAADVAPTANPSPGE